MVPFTNRHLAKCRVSARIAVVARCTRIGIGSVVTEQDRRRIIREWNREIEDETRRLTVRTDDGPWKLVAWGVLWLVWLGALLALVAGARLLGW